MLHAWHDVSPGNEVPRDFQAMIEIPLGSNVKYELDKPTGLRKVDHTTRRFFIRPSTASFREPTPTTTIRLTCWSCASSLSSRSRSSRRGPSA